jgi:hypothetical protein
MRRKDQRSETSRAQLKEKLGEQVDEAYRSVSDGAARSGFYVFFSFDLVSATRFKEVDPDRWPLVISRFYELITGSAERRLAPVGLWKLVGDEVLLYKRIRAIEELRGCLPSAHAILLDTIQRLHREFPRTNPLLSVKSAVWCARVHYLGPQELSDAQVEFSKHGYRNIVVPHLATAEFGEGEQPDFLGPEIDVGFRISKFVSRRRLVVSAELAYMLYRERSKCEPIEDQLRIIDYQPLKGIWDGRRYPIIWFEPKWDDTAGTFQYDERFDNDLVQRIASGRTEPLRGLPRVFDDLNRTDQMSALYNFVTDLKPDGEGTEPTVVPAVRAPAVEVHCVAVGFRRSDNRALLARRPYSKNRFPGQWEFGCGQVSPGSGFDDALARAYRDDFGAELAFPGGLQPVSVYEIVDEKARRTIPGIIFVAEITNPDAVQNYRHVELEWVDAEDPDELPEAEGCVPDLRESLQKAATAWKRLVDTSRQSKVA